MNKRGRNAERKGEGLAPNNQNAADFEIRTVRDHVQRASQKPSGSTNKQNSQSVFYGTDLPCFFNLVPAEAKLKELNASRNAPYLMFAFDRNAEGAKMWVIGRLKDFTTICFHRKISNKYSGYNYEVLMDGQPMKLYCDCEYLEADNPGKDKDRVLRSLLYYICKAYHQMPMPNNWNTTLNSEDLLVETCHRDGKVSYHVKIPEKFGVVTSMGAQRAFWSRVVILSRNDLKSDVDENRVRAEELSVFRNWKGKPIDDSVVDFSVYKDHAQCFRNLKAAKHPKINRTTRPEDYLVPLGKSVQDITEDEWKESLIMHVSGDARMLEVPKEWSKPNEITQRQCRAIRVFDSDIHGVNEKTKEDVRRADMDDNQFKIFSSVLIAIDPKWSIANRNLLQVRYGYLNPKVDILPKYIYLFPRTKYCPIKKGSHDTCCSWLKISQDGMMIISCFSSNHGDKQNYQMYSHEDKKLKEKEDVMIEIWGKRKWSKALNLRYAFVKSLPNKSIVEYYQNSIEYYKAEHLTQLFANCQAYFLQHQSGNRDDALVQSEDPGQPQRVLKLENPFKSWFLSLDRRDVNEVKFDPNSKDCVGDINTWHGFNITPTQSNNPCPRLLKHIRTILVSNNEEHYEFLLNWLCWIIQRPGDKTGVAVVFVSDQGTGKSTLVNVLQKIFGIHCLQITNSQHLFTQFSSHMDNRVLIVLNESTWGGDKAHEGWVKAAITDDDSLSQAKYGEIKSIKNYWNLMFVSNQPWCYPASDDNRRFFCPTVSNQRIRDHQYFNDLHDEIDNGGAEELLHFLMTRQIPEGWTPAKFLPNRTKTHFVALMEDRKNSALKWFVSKLKQSEWREWIPISYDGDSFQKEKVLLISANEATHVPSKRLQKVWELARANNRELRDHALVKDFNQLRAFFEKLFDRNEKWFKYINSSVGGVRTRCYRFASMKEIRKFFAKEHGYYIRDEEEHT